GWEEWWPPLVPHRPRGFTRGGTTRSAAASAARRFRQAVAKSTPEMRRMHGSSRAREAPAPAIQPGPGARPQCRKAWRPVGRATREELPDDVGSGPFPTTGAWRYAPRRPCDRHALHPDVAGRDRAAPVPAAE